jgi:hypothetical protein
VSPEVVWIGWLALFLVYELVAALARPRGGTLSATIWRWFGVRAPRPLAWLRRSVLGCFLGALAGHLVMGWSVVPVIAFGALVVAVIAWAVIADHRRRTLLLAVVALLPLLAAGKCDRQCKQCAAGQLPADVCEALVAAGQCPAPEPTPTPAPATCEPPCPDGQECLPQQTTPPTFACVPKPTPPPGPSSCSQVACPPGYHCITVTTPEGTEARCVPDQPPPPQPTPPTPTPTPPPGQASSCPLGGQLVEGAVVYMNGKCYASQPDGTCRSWDSTVRVRGDQAFCFAIHGVVTNDCHLEGWGDAAKRVACEMELLGRFVGKPHACPEWEGRCYSDHPNEAECPITFDHYGSPCTGCRDNPDTPEFEGWPKECGEQRDADGNPKAGFFVVAHGKGQVRACRPDHDPGTCGPWRDVDW